MLFKSSGDGQIRSASPKDAFQTDGFVTYENCSDRLRWQMRVLPFMSRDSSIHLISESRASWRGFDPAKICPFGGN
jgi:hypothetical protein